MGFSFWGSGQKKIDVQDAYGRILAQQGGAHPVSAFDVNSGQQVPFNIDSANADELARLQKARRSQDNFDKWMKIAQGASFATMGAGAAGAAGAFGGGAAASGASAAAPSAAGAATGTSGSLATGGAIAHPAASAASSSWLAKLFGGSGFGTAVNAATSLYGQHAATKAADQARADQLAANREALELQRKQLETEARNADLDRADAKALNDAINALKKQELDAAEEERQFTRDQTLRQNALVDASEARKAPYRAASGAALNKLAAMWGIG